MHSAVGPMTPGFSQPSPSGSSAFVLTRRPSPPCATAPSGARLLSLADGASGAALRAARSSPGDLPSTGVGRSHLLLRFSSCNLRSSQVGPRPLPWQAASQTLLRNGVGFQERQAGGPEKVGHSSHRPVVARCCSRQSIGGNQPASRQSSPDRLEPNRMKPRAATSQLSPSPALDPSQRAHPMRAESSDRRAQMSAAWGRGRRSRRRPHRRARAADRCRPYLVRHPGPLRRRSRGMTRAVPLSPDLAVSAPSLAPTPATTTSASSPLAHPGAGVVGRGSGEGPSSIDLFASPVAATTVRAGLIEKQSTRPAGSPAGTTQGVI